MLMALGMFVFSTDTLLPDGIDRDRDWRHERAARFGARAASQFTGPGDDRIVLSGSLVPELAGDYGAIERLAEMAEQGEAWPLMNGRGEVLGQFTIDRLSERKGNLIDTGAPRRTDFTLELSRVT
ncbi:phage tail protein [Novosphingobium huizhouense]|uniref:phage tail protein n=1 Tax=Novosphingobium huizhouense TaxID=2866625 RepID=UPI001CD8433B|nr:phage tail protein [Novosphingobium huizhouense]